MRFMQTESVLQTKNRSEPAKNRFSVALTLGINYAGDKPHMRLIYVDQVVVCGLFPAFMTQTSMCEAVEVSLCWRQTLNKISFNLVTNLMPDILMFEKKTLR